MTDATKDDMTQNSDTQNTDSLAESAEIHDISADSSNANARIASLEAEILEMKDKMLRALADADNTRKRAERMQIEGGKYAVTGFARDMLDVADNLHRALSAVPEDARTNEHFDNFAKGIEATERVMAATLEKHGLRRIAPESGQFDPNVHEVMFEADIPGKNAGEIIQLLEAGYMLHDRLLRPARVGVAKGDPAASSQHSVDETA